MISETFSSAGGSLGFEGIKAALSEALANGDNTTAAELQIAIAQVLCDMAYSGEFLKYEPGALSSLTKVAQGRANCVQQANMVANLWRRSFGMKEIWGAVTRGHAFAIVRLANQAFLALDGRPQLIHIEKLSGILYPSIGYRWVVIVDFDKCVMGSMCAHSASNAFERGDLESAESLLRSALRLIPRDPDMHFCLGNILVAAARLEEAESEYAYALSVDPADDFYRNAMDSLLRLRGVGRVDTIDTREGL